MRISIYVFKTRMVNGSACKCRPGYRRDIEKDEEKTRE